MNCCGALPMRTPAFAPQQFTPELRGWVAALWRRPVEDWTFAFLRDEFRARNVTQDVSAIARSDAGPAWQAAIERYLQMLGDRQRALDASVQREAAEHSERKAVVARLSTALDEEKRTGGRLAAEGEALRTAHAGAKAAALKLQDELARHARVGASRGGDPSAVRGRVRDVVEPGAEASQSQHEALQGQIASQRQELERERAETGRWWTATAQLQHELALIRSSWSWRITTPLRIVRRWLAGFGRAARALLLRSARSGVGWAARFAGRHPGLKVWIVTRLERHPRVIASLKRAGAFPAVVAPMVVVRRDAAANSALGRDGAELLAQLEREIERQAADSSRPS